MKKLLLLIMVLLITFIPSKAQRVEGVIGGLIVDENNMPLPYATLSILTKDSVSIANGVTDEQGKYSVKVQPQSKYLIKVSYIGYKTVVKEWEEKIQVFPDASLMNEVIVKTERPRMKMSDGKLAISVSGTVLENEYRVLDVLKKLPGLLETGNGELKTIEGFTPSYYLNGRQIQDLSELSRIDVKNIKSVVVDNSPGARYGSAVKCVVDIQTFVKQKGLAILITSDAELNHKFSYGSGISANYESAKYSYFAGFNRVDSRRKSYQDIDVEIEEPIGTVKKTIKEVMRGTSVGGESNNLDLGITMTLTPKVILGVSYHASLSHMNNLLDFNATSNNQLNEIAIDGTNSSKDRKITNHLNSHLEYTINKRATFMLYSDFYNARFKRNLVVEEEENGNTSTTNILNRSDNTMLSFTPIYNYLLGKGKIEAGGELTLMRGKSSNEQINTLQQDRYSSFENMYAAFLNYRFNLWKGALQLGVRYEHVVDKLENLEHSNLSVYKKYSNILASSVYSVKIGNVSNALSFRTSVERPSFGVLNDYSMYLNQFSVQKGNQYLQPATSYQLRYDLAYKFLFFSLTYRLTKNYIGSYFHLSDDYPDAYIYSWMNYKRQDSWSAVLSMHKKIGRYDGRITCSYVYSKLDAGVETAYLPNRPKINVALNNSFNLGHHWNLSLDYIFTSKYTNTIYSFRSMNEVDMSLQKSFRQDKVQCSFFVNDIFRKTIARYVGRIEGIFLKQYEDQDRRKIGLDIRIRVNDYKKSSKERFSGESVINRL